MAETSQSVHSMRKKLTRGTKQHVISISSNRACAQFGIIDPPDSVTGVTKMRKTLNVGKGSSSSFLACTSIGVHSAKRRQQSLQTGRF